MAVQKVGVIGSGQVGGTLADGFIKHGYQTMRGSREPAKLADWARGHGDKGRTGTLADTVRDADLVVLAVKGLGAEDIVKSLGTALDGRIVIDTSNPIADAPPVNGVLQYFTNINESLMERLQKLAPKARFVKAFSCVGHALMVNPDLPGGPATMFICGSDAAAKADVKRILDQFGWATEDLGAVEAARAIEPLCILWCIPGFLQNRWTHALKMVNR